MTTKVAKEMHCINCGAPLDDKHVTQCPVCGQQGRKITVKIDEVVKVVDSPMWAKTRMFYEKNPIAFAVAIGITVGAPFLGFIFDKWEGVIVGLMLGAVAFMIGLFAVTKVRETERSS